jgi:outer membrane protein OmpA-like peptidoglycan-associated protein
MRCHLRAAVLVVIAPTLAHADGWLVAEAPAAMAVSDAQQGVFRPGLMPALGLYADNGRFAIGARVRTGVLRNGPAPGDHRADPGIAGLTSAGLALRLLVAGGWGEVVGGGGLTGQDLVPTIELGVGWSFAAGKVEVGPSVRYVRVISRDPMQTLGTAELALVGIDVRFGKQRPAQPLRFEPPPRVEVVIPPPPPPPPPAERDPDTIVEHETSCVDDLEGCRITDQIMVVNDRIILDDRVLFDLDRARVKSGGRELVAQIVTLWRGHPEWKRLAIEGHADARGSDQHNLELSQLRAERVRDFMLKLGCPAEEISAVGFGRSRIRDTGTTELAHQHNRRVEFVIERGEP